MLLLGAGAILGLSWLVCRIVVFVRPVKYSLVRRLLSFACFPVAFAVAIVVATTDIGFCGRLWLCETEVARFARTVQPQTDWESQKSARVGLFAVTEVDRHGDCVRMITAKDFLDDAGLTYCPVGQPPRIGEDSYRHLWGPWWHWHRSW